MRHPVSEGDALQRLRSAAALAAFFAGVAVNIATPFVLFGYFLAAGLR